MRGAHFRTAVENRYERCLFVSAQYGVHIHVEARLAVKVKLLSIGFLPGKRDRFKDRISYTLDQRRHIR